MRKGLPVNLLIAFGLVVVGCFLSWGSFRLDAGSAKSTIEGTSTPVPGGAGAFGDFFGTGARLDVSAWNSTANLLGLALPNWLVLAVGTFLAMFGLMECFPHTCVPYPARLAFSIYGVLHLGAVGLTFLQGGTVGPGYVLVLVAFLAMVVLSLRSNRVTEPESTPTTRT